MSKFKVAETACDEIAKLASYVAGFAASAHDPKLAEAAEWLEKLADMTCAQGYVGCYGGRGCTSDHK